MPVDGEVAGGEKELLAILQCRQVHRPAVLVLLSPQKNIGLATGLGAHASVSASPADGRGEQTLAGVAVAESAVNEDLQTQFQVFGHGLDLVQADLPRQDHALESKFGRPCSALAVVNGHLRRSMQVQFGGQPACQRRQSDVLHQDGICAHLIEAEQVQASILQLMIQDQGVDGHIDPEPAQVGVVDGFCQCSLIEVDGEFPGSKSPATEVNSICTRGHRSPERLGRASRGEELRQSSQDHLNKLYPMVRNICLALKMGTIINI